MVIDRRKIGDGRELYDAVLSRSELLEPEDRVLLEQVLGKGVKPREIAAITDESARTVQRRVRGLVIRLMDGRVEWVIRHHRRWGEPLRSVGLGVWVKGWTLREASERLGLSLHRVRESVTAVKGMLALADRGDRARGAWRDEEERARLALRRAGRDLGEKGVLDGGM